MRHALTLSLACACAGVVAAQPAPPDPSHIARLITQLGSGDFQRRETATAELAALGPHALEALRRATAAADPELRRRAEELVRRLETRVESQRLLAGKR